MSSSVQIHPTAIIEQGAELDHGVTVGPYSIIGKNVRVGKNTCIHSHVVLQGHSHFGEENQIFSFAALGNPPQDLKYKGEETKLTVGNRNIIREYVTIQPGTVQGGGITSLGDGNLIMAYAHVAHDCRVGNQNIFANGTQLAGHVTIQNMAVLGGLSAVHQFCTVGDMSMTSGGTMVKKDLPPYCIADGFRGVLRGLNIVALQRRQVSVEARNAIKRAYKIFFMENAPTIQVAIDNLPQSDVSIPEIQKLIAFIQSSKRGVLRPSFQNKSDNFSDHDNP